MNKLIIFSGLPGTGKTTLAKRLASELACPLICIDDVIGDIPDNAGIPFWDSRVTVLLDVVNTQLELGLNVIADSVFMNMDRYHAQELARKHNIRFLPVYVFISDESVWKERVTKRVNELKHPEVATWDRIQHQRQRFREWEPGTALFIDSLHSFEDNYQQVLSFVTNEEIDIKPLEDISLETGKYH